MNVSMAQVFKAVDYANSHPDKYLNGTTNWCAAVAFDLNRQASMARQPPALGGDPEVLGRIDKNRSSTSISMTDAGRNAGDEIELIDLAQLAPLQAEIERQKFQSHCHLQRAVIAEKKRDQLKARCDELEAAVQHLVCSGYLKLLPEEVQQRFTACMRDAQSDSLRVALSTPAGSECCATCSSRNGSNYCDCGDD